MNILTNFNSTEELSQTFHEEQLCVEYLEEIRWEGYVISPFDSTSKVYKCKNNKYRCKNTGKYFNVKTGTIFDNSKLSLQKWFLAIWLVRNEKEITPSQLSKKINITQNTAWFMLTQLNKCFEAENNSDLEKNEVLEVNNG
jgi:transposase-like protein